ncbi:glycosyltransferase [Streptomyces sp. CB01881]|uniref:glycosyltransferase n=1 Tax=Streptomyces sp. CB01881 TaxID=2078691 RepID=UPI001386B0DE|nr:glycosyltransferase [Streptomyces sp. CB01881]
MELDLGKPGELRSPGEFTPVGGCEERVLALVRHQGHPLGLIAVTSTAGDSGALHETLAQSAHRQLSVGKELVLEAAARRRRAACGKAPAALPLVSVIVCTRDRTEMLPACLDSVLRIDYPRLEVILVDNAPSGDATERLVRSRYGERIRYVREPAPGLSRARNRGLTLAGGDICAFTDDDALTDPGWVTALVEAFDDGDVACVTGMVLPAELDTQAQLTSEAYATGVRGFTARRWSLRGPLEDPLAQFSPGRFGCGANMAFRTAILRATGGFDPATGAGTPSRGGEDLLAFQQVLTAGHTVMYQPDAIVWHRHRRTMEALARQVEGYGIGYTAFLTAAVRHRPRLLATLLRRLPSGLWRWYRANQRRTLQPDAPLLDPRHDDTIRALRRLERRGLLYGPYYYLQGIWRQRHTRGTEDSGRRRTDSTEE